MATEITVMSSGSAEPGLGFVAAEFTKQTGNQVKITYNLGADGSRQLGAGAAYDVLVATSNSINRSYKPEGLVEGDGVGVGRVGLGVMVRPGAPVPDVSTVEALKRAVLDAETVLITTETSGIYIESMLKKLGIHEQAAAKMPERYNNGPSIMARVLAGKGREIGFLSTNAIRTYADKGLVLAGPLPDEVQFAREFLAIATKNSAHPEVARAFVQFCGGPGKPIMRANGFL